MRKRLAIVSHFRRRREWLCNGVAVLKGQIDRPFWLRERKCGAKGLGDLVLSRAVAIFPCTFPAHACPAAV
jgi:hypothetical protein